MIVLRVLPEKFLWPHYSGAPGARGPRFIELPEQLIFHYIATPNIGGDIPIDVPTNQNIGGDTSPASPAGLTPMRLTHVRKKKCFRGISERSSSTTGQSGTVTGLTSGHDETQVGGIKDSPVRSATGHVAH